MTFVAIGFQHVVANMFVIPAAIFAGHFTWAEYFPNFIFVFFGNLVGGMLFVALPYFISYNKKLPAHQEKTEMKNKSLSLNGMSIKCPKNITNFFLRIYVRTLVLECFIRYNNNLNSIIYI